MYHEVTCQANNSAAADWQRCRGARPSSSCRSTPTRRRVGTKCSSARCTTHRPRRRWWRRPGQDSPTPARRAFAPRRALDFRSLYKQPLGRYYFHVRARRRARAGRLPLGVGRYRRLGSRGARSRAPARRLRGRGERDLLDGVADASAADASRRSSSGGAWRSSGRRAQRAEQVQKAKEMVQRAQARLLSRKPLLDLFDEMQQRRLKSTSSSRPSRRPRTMSNICRCARQVAARAPLFDPIPARWARTERLHSWGRRLPRIPHPRRRRLRSACAALKKDTQHVRSEEDG